ncbi:MAG TPA: glycosyltransferase, partial [Sandaracinaceae bacterium LLY-WYZ-13_1]|nr:glycosyltransferase [Sandaracinaceae bacterium LLY-WYZ-13_1]
MRILHVTRDFPPRVNGGISTAVGALVDASRAAGVACAVLSFDAWRPRGRRRAARLPDDETTVRLVGPEDLTRARAFAEAFAPDVVHLHHAMLLEPTRAMVAEAPRVFSVHVVQSALRRLRALEEPTASERAQATAMREAARVLVPSEATRRDVLAEAPALAERVRVTPFPVGALGSGGGVGP